MKRQSEILILPLFLCIFAVSLLYAQGDGSSREYGALNLASHPSGAKVIINGIETGYKTPAHITHINTGINTVELSLPNYLFAKRQILIIKDSTLRISFNLISLSDTAHIIGDLQLGVLRLPPTPLKTPYLIDNKQIYSQETTLNTGKHWIVWEGGNLFTSLDTIVEIFPGKLTVVNFVPRRLYGELSIRPTPADADISINDRYYGTGTINTSIATGTYQLSLRRSGHYSVTRTITVSPHRNNPLFITLTPIPDRDDDGFLDSLDLCPDQYGLYGGCPRQNKLEALKKYRTIFLSNLDGQPPSLTLNSANWQGRSPNNQIFKQFISYFNDGTILFNNVNGLSFLNSFQIAWKGIVASVDLGQYFMGMEYKKDRYFPLVITTPVDTYSVWYDTTARVEPRVLFPSTVMSLGFSIQLRGFNIINSVGYRWEDILIEDLITNRNKSRYDQKDVTVRDPSGRYIGPRVNLTYNNDQIFAAMRIEYDLLQFTRSVLIGYAAFQLSVSSHQKSGWTALSIGLSSRFGPRANPRE